MMTYPEQLKKKVTSNISVKLVVIGVLIMILQIPLFYVGSLINERQSMQYQAQHEISQRWGGTQHIGAPLLNVSYKVNERVKNKVKVFARRSLILPASIDLDVNLNASKRYLGMYEVPVFVSHVKMHGTIEFNPTQHLGQTDQWQLESLFIPIKSMRGLKKIKKMTINNQAVNLSQEQGMINGMNGIKVDVKQFKDSQQLKFIIELDLAGSERFEVLPMAGQTTVSMQSNWPAPSFNGDFLPESRTINSEGFNAKWQVNELNHNLGRVIKINASSSQANSHFNSQPNWPVFGAQIFIPANSYLVIERTIKYSLLIMILTFAGFFLAEMFFKLCLHPFQYLLIGFSLSVFYLLLLSISEYLRFEWAFLMAAFSVVVLIGGYCSVVLRQRKRGIYTAFLFTGLYAFIFTLVKAEQLSLLMGAVAIWLFLASVMYWTRKIDWYAVSSQQK